MLGFKSRLAQSIIGQQMLQITTENAYTSVFLIILILIVVRRAGRPTTMNKFSLRKIFLRPAIYVAIAAAVSISLPEYEIVSTVILALAGVYAAISLSIGIEISYIGSELHYKKSRGIMLFWGIAVILRYLLAAYFPIYAVASISVDLLLGATTGLLLVEAIKIYILYKKLKAKEAKHM